MKTLTTSLLLCAGLLVGAAAQAQPAQAGTWSKNVDGFWVISYQKPAPITSDQVSAELARAKATGQYAFGEEDYPGAMPSGPSESRAQVQDELQHAQQTGMMESDQEAYPPTASTNMTDIH